MFSGIIETVGTIQSIQALDGGFRYVIRAPKLIFGTNLGDSIATDGICLTVTKKTWSTFTVEVMKETIQRTALSLWKERIIIVGRKLKYL
jgi:riboflavin synthase